MNEKTISDLIGSRDNDSWHIYGSGSWSPNTARDFDILCLSDCEGYPHCKSEKVKIEGFTRISNIYYIPKRVFENDCLHLRFGGYYSFKFALSFRELGSILDYDPAKFFWASQISWIKSIAKTNDVDCLIRGLHLLVLHFNPTFFRSLLRFIHSRDYQRLREWIVKNIDLNDIKPRSSPELEKCFNPSFYLFWREYHRHKDYGPFPGPNTVSKLNRSLSEIQRAELNGYFDNVPVALLKLIEWPNKTMEDNDLGYA